MLTPKEEIITIDDRVEVVCTPETPIFDEDYRRPRRRGRPSKNASLMCALCDFQAEDFSLIEKHMMIHTDKVAHGCPYCRALFSQRGNLRAHIRTHTKERPFKCDVCNFASTQKGNLNVHYRKHTKEKPYRCHYCDFTAAQVANLRSHLLRRHSGAKFGKDFMCDEKMYKCNQCEFVFRQKDEMVEHVRLLHPQCVFLQLKRN